MKNFVLAIFYSLFFLSNATLVAISGNKNNTSCCESTHDDFTNLDVCIFVDQMPVFKNSDYANEFDYFVKKLALKVDYSHTSFKCSFVIDKRGKLIGPRIIGKSIKDYTENEIKLMKCLNNMPLWKPGSCQGKVVPVLVSTRINVDFQR